MSALTLPYAKVVFFFALFCEEKIFAEGGRKRTRDGSHSDAEGKEAKKKNVGGGANASLINEPSAGRPAAHDARRKKKNRMSKPAGI